MPNNLQAEDKAGTKTRKRRFAEALVIKASPIGPLNRYVRGLRALTQAHLCPSANCEDS
jgi:hypothetical protein